jgi:hypothetical protein
MNYLRCLVALSVVPLAGPFVERSISAEEQITGQVCDADGPVAGAVIRFKGDDAFVYTDADGRFQLPRPVLSRRIVASKDGYLIAGIRSDEPALTLTLQRLPTEDNEAYAWVDPSPDPKSHGNCANCHAEMFREWSQSGHARSISNRRFLNLYEGSDWKGRRNVGWSLFADHADGAGVCTSCHAPTVPFSDPAYYDLRKTRGVAAQGVHCDYCHKIADVSGEHNPLTHGRFGLRLLRPAKEQLFFGSLDDVDRGEDTFSPLYRQSRYCASCHEGIVFGVHVYSTYSEWLASPAGQQGQQCQSCHMAPTGRMTNVAPGKGGITRDPQTLANHRFFAGSQEEMLRRCVKVSTNLITSTDEVRALVDIRVEGAGHRVPTGFVDRHLMLVVEGLDKYENEVNLLRGPKLPPSAGPELAGRAGQLYAKVLTDFDGRSPAPFWIARPEVADSRLEPGKAQAAEFGFPAAARSVRVRVLYRRFWDEVRRTKGWPDDTVTVVEQTTHLP